MDKKNQSNNSVGDSSKLSHKSQLPPIWDNISQELNALDGDAIPMTEQLMNSDELSDLADFSSIKEGFQANFSTKEPPKFMWDKIEQDLESFTITDLPADFSAIKTGFEQNYKEKALPNFTWADLAEEMDNPKPKEKVEDYTFVKRGFEKQYSAVVVPLFSWADLAQRMDYEAVLSDTPDGYSIIKESFHKEYAAHQPAANTWAALDQQLQEKSQWKKAWMLLSTPAFLKKVALFTAIGLFTFGSKCYLFDTPTSVNTPSGSILASDQSNKEPSTFDKIKASSLNNTGSRSYTVDGLETQNTTTNQDQINAGLLLPKKEHLTIETGIKHSSEKNKTSEKNSTLEGVSNNPSVVNNKKEVVDNAFIDNNNNSLPPLLADKNTASKSTPNGLTILDKENEVSIPNQVALNEDDILRSNLKLLANRSNSSWIGQDIMDIELLDDGLSVLVQKFVIDQAIPKMEADNFTLVRQAQKGKKIRFEIGLVGRAGTSILLGKNTYDAWNGNNVTTQMCPTGAFGILSNYYLGLNDAVVLGIYPYSTLQQCFGTYNNDGTYEETKVNLSLFDITLGYQRTLIRYNSLSQVPATIYARLDLGLGILTRAKTSINEQAISTKNLYNKFNFSAGLALGNTHEIKQFIIDYGLTGSIGLNNLVTASKPTILEPAKLLNIGAYLGIRYLISPRLDPSKKQRQFDWSPPFYIEEPVF
jgi:hypothetical protein